MCEGAGISTEGKQGLAKSRCLVVCQEPQRKEGNIENEVDGQSEVVVVVDAGRKKLDDRQANLPKATPQDDPGT